MRYLTFDLTVWDVALIVTVTAQCLLIAYAASPRWKGLFLSLPFPFTIVAISVGRPVDASTVLALFVLLAYTQGVRFLYKRWHLPIGLAIVFGVLGYSLIGWAGAGLVPTGDAAFAVACAITISVGFALRSRHRSEVEQSHRTTLPISLKLPAIFAVVAFLVSVRHALAGFAPLFPLIAVIGAYETRHSLWTLSKPIFTLMVALPAMLIVTRMTQTTLGLETGLLLGWIVFLPVLFVLRRNYI